MISFGTMFLTFGLALAKSKFELDVRVTVCCMTREQCERSGKSLTRLSSVDSEPRVKCRALPPAPSETPTSDPSETPTTPPSVYLAPKTPTTPPSVRPTLKPTQRPTENCDELSWPGCRETIGCKWIYEDGMCTTEELVPCGAGCYELTRSKALSSSGESCSCSLLDLHDKQITELRPGALDSFTQLERLDLSWNKLNKIVPGAFDYLTRLKELRLQVNKLTELPPGALDSLTLLESLSLFRNKLTKLPPGALDSLSQLKKLELASNKITELPPLDSLALLESLDLVNNELTELPPGALDSLTLLESLDLFGNWLTEIVPGSLDSLTRLKFLDLGTNQLTEIPLALSALTQLEILDLSFNKLTELHPGALDSLSQLKKLYLYNNELTELRPGVLDSLTLLEELDLSYNKLTEIVPGSLDSLTRLKFLYLEYNQLTEIQPGALDGLTALESLNLDSNQLTELGPGTLDGLTALLSLDLYGNPLGCKVARPDTLSDWSFSVPANNDLLELCTDPVEEPQRRLLQLRSPFPAPVRGERRRLQDGEAQRWTVEYRFKTGSRKRAENMTADVRRNKHQFVSWWEADLGVTISEYNFVEVEASKRSSDDGLDDPVIALPGAIVIISVIFGMLVCLCLVTCCYGTKDEKPDTKGVNTTLPDV